MVALLLLGTSLAAAQDVTPPAPVGAPLRLGPPGAQPPIPQPPAAAPPAGGIGLDGGPRGASQRPGDSVEIAPLAAADPDGLGVRVPTGEPLTPELWNRTPRDIATVLLQRLPAGLASPTLRELQRRLLLAPARVPDGNAPQGAPRLIALRIAKLLEMGDVESAAALMRVLPPGLDDEPTMRLKVEMLWLSDKREEACAEVTKQIAHFTGVFWQQAQVACQVAGGQGDAASLGAQLLREQGFNDPAFFNLVESAAGGARNLPIDKLGPVTPATVLLLRAAKREPSADSLANSAPGVLRALALAPELPLPMRLAVAERAAGFGALSPEALGQIYMSLDAPPADIANAAALSKSDKSARARAVLFRAVRTQTNTAMRFELMRAAFDSARAAGLFVVAAQLYRPLIEEAPPNNEIGWFAGEAARALLVAGAPDLARRWYDLARARAVTDGDAGKAQAQLWALFRLAGLDDGPFEPVRLLAWYDAQSVRPAAALSERATAVYGLLASVGERVPSGAWLPLLVNAADAPKPVPGTGALVELAAAAADTRLGETIALAAGAIGPRDPSAAGTLACTGVTSALKALGLTASARRFALEAALAAGA
ncbi:MAG: hypothetical protein JO021_24335 [Alphaproteobacteria bacterium]|nr:hypothetical protein [Alphaproteobacteria bacterium]